MGSSIAPLPILGADKKGIGLAKGDGTGKRIRRSQDGESVEGVDDEGDGESYGLPLIAFGACILVAVGLVAYGIFSNLTLSSDNMSLKNQVDDLAYAQDVYDTYIQTQSDYE